MTGSDPHACPAELATNFCGQRHWAIYWILIICSVAMLTGRVMSVGSEDGAGAPTPFFCANDRSRWCTIRSLGDDGTYEIDAVIDDTESEIAWNTIDKVKHVGEDGRMHSYSSKPTLLPTILAGKYIAIKALTGLSITEDPIIVARIMLVLSNVIPWAVYLWFLAATLEKIGVRDWTRYFVLAVAAFGTYLSTFGVSLNNHVPAAISVMIAVYCITEIYRVVIVGEKKLRWRDFFLAGLFAAFAAANELPALSFLGMAGLLCLAKSFRMTLLAFVPGMLIVVAGFFGTNWLAHGSWIPAYAHRNDGAVIAEIDFSAEAVADLDSGVLPESIEDAISQEVDFTSPVVIRREQQIDSTELSRWVVRDRSSTNQISITNTLESKSFRVHLWDNWYDYPESYWFSDKKSEVDRGQESVQLYAFHVLFGHHGIFSLTPIWLLAFAGMFSLTFNDRLNLRWLGMTTIVISLVVIAFYISRPVIDRNYGGWTSALRWLFWLAPLWLVSMLPVVDWLGKSRGGRIVCFVLLGASILSAIYAADNPWVHPWLYEVWEWTGLPE
ncbi:MAG: hypothetical protein AAF456_02320 [Planctomycetota bacterium]